MKLRMKQMIMIILNILLLKILITSDNFAARLAQENLTSKNDIT